MIFSLSSVPFSEHCSFLMHSIATARVGAGAGRWSCIWLCPGSVDNMDCCHDNYRRVFSHWKVRPVEQWPAPACIYTCTCIQHGIYMYLQETVPPLPCWLLLIYLLHRLPHFTLRGIPILGGVMQAKGSSHIPFAVMYDRCLARRPLLEFLRSGAGAYITECCTSAYGWTLYPVTKHRRKALKVH